MTPAFHDNEGPPPVGYFTYSVVGDHWSWSDGMYALHGVQREDVTPSTALLLAHLHPDDRSGVYEALDNAMRAATPFTCYHRVIDRHGREHSVLLVGRGVRDDRGLVEKLEGYVVDIAPRPLLGLHGAVPSDPHGRASSFLDSDAASTTSTTSLVTYLPEPGSASADVLALLASGATTDPNSPPGFTP